MEGFGEAFVRGLVELYSFIEPQEREAMFPKPRLNWEEMTPTERILHKMMFEARVHILDSGSFYGRNWERARRIGDLRKLPVPKVRVEEDGVYVYYPLFHFLNDWFEYDLKLDGDFHRFANSPEWRREAQYDVIYAWLEEKGFELLTKGNSYNGETILDQDFQFWIFSPEDIGSDTDWIYVEDGVYAIIQTHNGCDIRGGYSTPHVFKLRTDYASLLNAVTDLYATNGEMGWYSDDAGWHWYRADGKEIDPLKEWELDPKNNKVYHNGREVVFDVYRGY